MSDSDDDPIDNLILRKAESRAATKRAAEDNGAVDEIQREYVAAADASGEANGSRRKKRSRKKSATPTASEANKDATLPYVSEASEAANETSAAPQQKEGPVGVVVLEDGDPEPNYEMQKLLRAPRYFDEVYEPKGVACWRCGKRGHLAKDCMLSEARPCVYCAQYGHESRDCPHRICYRCGLPGHMTNNCTQRSGTATTRGTCMRCGRPNCAAADYLDWFRYEGGCDQEYYNSDLDMVRCFVCGQKGHLSCQPAPLSAPRPSCWNCGGSHWAEECPQEYPSHLMAERLQDRDRQKQQRARQDQWEELQQQRQQLMQQQQQQQHAVVRRPQHPPQQRWQPPPAGYLQQQWDGQQQGYAGGQQWAGQAAGSSAGRYAGGPDTSRSQRNWQQQRQQFQQQQQQQRGWQGQQYQDHQQLGVWQGQQRFLGQQHNDFPGGRGNGRGGGGDHRMWR